MCSTLLYLVDLTCRDLYQVIPANTKDTGWLTLAGAEDQLPEASFISNTFIHLF